MQAKQALPVIQRLEQNPASGDYQYLYEQGLEWISQYSGDIWNNYNLGDPGVTILQTLCYALTELSYKTSLPIEDILTRENGGIDFKNHFVKPQNILPSSPVSLVDFKKKLIDEVVELKQVYFNLNNSETINVFTPYLELKPDFFKDDETQYDDIKSKVDQVLLDYQNIGQLFKSPIVLDPHALKLIGQINISASINVEEFIARLIFAINTYLSPYPSFFAYEELLEEGKSNDEIFDGPLLNGGFLADDNFISKRKFIFFQDLMVAINEVDGVISVSNINIETSSKNIKQEEKGIKIKPSEVYYFKFENLFNGGLEIIQNGRYIDSISEDKVEYELLKLIPQPKRPTDFEEYLPKGTFRDIGAYYSIQHHFPEIYELNKKFSSHTSNPLRSSKNKQLKAYLGLFEQILANYLAQLNHVGDLFSFDSGRNRYQLAGKTYYFQDLYDVPGIQEILRDVRGYSRNPSEKNEAEDWNAYKRDHLNPYRQELMASIESPETNLIRKNKALKHLLARFGVEYSSSYLSLTNPSYGDDQTAEVVQISDTLKTFPLLSANRARSYFYKGEATNTLYAGVELIADNQLNLNSYYEGLIESITQAFENDANSIEAIYCNSKEEHKIFGKNKISPDRKIVGHWIEIQLNKRLFFKFSDKDELFDRFIDEAGTPMKRDLFIQKLKNLLTPSLYTLERLIQQSKGFVFIDNIRLFKNFTFNLEIEIDFELGLDFVSDLTFLNLRIDEVQEIVAFIRGGMDVSFENFSLANSQVYKNWISASKTNESFLPEEIFDLLKTKNEIDPIEFKVTVINNINEKENKLISRDLRMPIPLHFLDSSVSIIIPEWIPLLQKPQYKEFFINKLREFYPMNVLFKVYTAQQSTMEDLLTYYNCWMGEILVARKENKFRCLREFENEEVWNILNILKKLKDNYESE